MAIRTLIADDSAFARKVVREMLSGIPGIEVIGAARDGEEAIGLTASLKPDVVICDLRMPNVDGVGYVRRQMRARPLPIIILSAADHDAAEVIGALEAGAIDVVKKPSALANDDLRAVRDELVAKITAAASAPLANLALPEKSALPQEFMKSTGKFEIVVIAISTGGPQALRRMMPMFAREFEVPIAIVLHMPVGYTALYAEKLNDLCQIEVKEAAEGDEVRPGRALLAPAGRHLCFRRRDDGAVVAKLTMVPLDKIHRPSADVMFQSAVEVFNERVLAVIMTGMGDDGKEGAAWVKAQGGTVLTEAEKSCVIYGMPRSVVEAGLSDAAEPLDNMAHAIASRI